MHKKYPSLLEQRVIYDVMSGMFEDLLAEPGGVRSVYAEEEAIHMLHAFEDGNFAPAPVEVLSRLALRDASTIHAVKNINPGDFI